MSPTEKGIRKGKGKGKRSVLPRDPEPDNNSGRVMFDRVLIFDIGVKICSAKDYKPIREVRILINVLIYAKCFK
jgi:hypothetical protein